MLERDRVEGVYRATHDRLWRALLAYSGDRDIASDAEAEAFSQAIRRGDELLDVERWVWRSAFKIAGGMLATRRSLGRPLEAGDGPADVPSATVEFVSMLAGLSAQQRACVVLRYVGLYTPAEIAELLETSPGTVSVQLHRAHETLRRQLRGPQERSES